MRADLRGRLSFRRGGLPTEERFGALEGEVQDHRAKQQDELAALARKVDSAAEAVDAATERLENERKQRLVRGLRWEEAGVWMFILVLFSRQSVRSPSREACA